ncbi:GNAT family N-acetyltransferase [Ornithinimicrobium sp. CNJ-824]|nr:GNAT family N-acetyltransferase [Ornithinimicrobium sp. CNJ-824]
MESADVPAVLDVQEPAAVAGLADVFPQDRHPFPREVVAARWREEIASPDVECLVALDAGTVVGFAAVRGDELLHLGTALERWGTGTAQEVHDLVVDHMRSRGTRRAWLWVFTDNRRGRRFYARLGWAPTGERSRSTFPPHAELLRLERDLSDPARRR